VHILRNPRQVPFLLHASVLVILFLTFWWFFPLHPFRSLIKGSVEVFAGTLFGRGSDVTITETGSGHLQVSLWTEASVPKSPPESGTSKQRVRMTYNSEYYPESFTFSLPVFWAIMLAAGGLRRNVKPLLFGTAVMILVEIFLALAYLKIFMHGSLLKLSGSETAFFQLLFKCLYYLVLQVAPFTVPFIAALIFSSELKWQIFHWGPNSGRKHKNAAKFKPSAKHV